MAKKWGECSVNNQKGLRLTDWLSIIMIDCGFISFVAKKPQSYTANWIKYSHIFLTCIDSPMDWVDDELKTGRDGINCTFYSVGGKRIESPTLRSFIGDRSFPTDFFKWHVIGITLITRGCRRRVSNFNSNAAFMGRLSTGMSFNSGFVPLTWMRPKKYLGWM